MNNKGFGLKEFIIVIAVVFVCLIIVMGLYNQATNKDEEDTQREDAQEEVTREEVDDDLTYHDLELTLKSAASRYQDATYQTTDDAVVSMVLTSDFLEKEDYLEPIRDLETKKPCEGYVLFNQNHAKITYRAYLKCDNYKTNGFDKKYLD